MAISALKAPPFGVKTGQRIQAQARTGDVAQTEHQAAEDDQYREQITTARDRCVGQVGRAHSGQRHDAPDIQLHHEVDQDRRQNAEGKRRPSVAVNVAVWVRNPGPMAEVAIMKIAAINEARRALVNSLAVCVTAAFLR